MRTKEEKFNIKDALDDVGDKITIHDSLMIVIITHGGSGGFGIRADISRTDAMNNPVKQGTSLSYVTLGNYINATFGNKANRKYAVMIIVNQACYSGTMKSYLDGDNRILISAADSEHETRTEWGYPRYQHWAFLYQGGQQHIPFSTNGFILSMGTHGAPVSLYTANIQGIGATNNNNGSPPYPRIFVRNLNSEEIYM